MTVDDVFDICNKELGDRMRAVRNNFGESWRQDIEQIFVAAFDQGELWDVVRMLEEHWDKYLSTRPEQDREKPSYGDLLNPTLVTIRKIQKWIKL